MHIVCVCVMRKAQGKKEFSLEIMYGCVYRADIAVVVVIVFVGTEIFSSFVQNQIIHSSLLSGRKTKSD